MSQATRRPRAATLSVFAVALSVALAAALSVAPAALAGALPRAKYEVTIFSDDAALAKRVLAKLQGMGYTNPENEVLDEPNTDLNIKFAADAPGGLVDELCRVVEPMIGGALARKPIFAGGDTDVFINLPKAQVKTPERAAPETPAPERSRYVVKVFTDDPAMGKAALTALAAVGYTHPDNVVRPTPNKDFNIKWGGAPATLIDEIAGILEPLAGAKLTRKQIFDPTDTEIFVNLPMSSPRSGKLDRAAFEVTVFSDDAATAKRVLETLRKMGYTNPGNEVLDEPNAEFNIKWGAAPEAMIDELSSVVGPMVRRELVRSHQFEANDHDIFINLPVCLLTGPDKPSTCP